MAYVIWLTFHFMLFYCFEQSVVLLNFLNDDHLLNYDLYCTNDQIYNIVTCLCILKLLLAIIVVLCSFMVLWENCNETIY